MKPRTLIIQNDEPETLGLYERYLSEKSDLRLFKAYKMGTDEQFPLIEDFDAFIIGPTPISANDVERINFLRKEWKFLKQLTQSEKPVLGVCCGGQMLSRALGGSVKPSPMKEIGGYKIELTWAGQIDPLFKGFPSEFPVFHWHSEMFTVPPYGVLLAEGRPCPIQAFGHGNVRGVLFHLEITADDAKRWVNAYPKEPSSIGKTTKSVIEECQEYENQMTILAERLVDNLLVMTRRVS
jgi:GMP synthase (glutamine-hydrolysing)